MGNGTHRPLDRDGPRLQFSDRRAHRTERLGAAGLSLHPGRSLQAIRDLQQSIRVGHPHLQQYFFRVDLSHALSNWRENLRSSSCPGYGLDMGAVPLRHLLAGTGGLGDEPQRVPVEPGIPAFTAHGGWAAAPARVDRIRPSVGPADADQYRGSVSAAVLPPLSAVAFAPAVPAALGIGLVHSGGKPARQPLAGAQTCRLRTAWF